MVRAAYASLPCKRSSLGGGSGVSLPTRVSRGSARSRGRRPEMSIPGGAAGIARRFGGMLRYRVRLASTGSPRGAANLTLAIGLVPCAGGGFPPRGIPNAPAYRCVRQTRPCEGVLRVPHKACAQLPPSPALGGRRLCPPHGRIGCPGLSDNKPPAGPTRGGTLQVLRTHCTARPVGAVVVPRKKKGGEPCHGDGPRGRLDKTRRQSTP